MGRSRLPLPSLLGLFGALLTLSPQLLLGIPEEFSDLPVNDPGVQKALAFAVEQYNLDTADSANYFKALRVLKTMAQANSRNQYLLMVDFVKTRCKKSRKMTYKEIQHCKVLPGKQEKRNCYFRVIPWSPPFKWQLAFTDCV